MEDGQAQLFSSVSGDRRGCDGFGLWWGDSGFRHGGEFRGPRPHQEGTVLGARGHCLGCRQGAPRVGLSDRWKVVSKGWVRSGDAEVPTTSRDFGPGSPCHFP